MIIEILRGRAQVIETALALEASGTPTYCTAAAWAEIYPGLRTGKEPSARAFFEARGAAVLDALVDRQTGASLARFARSHGVELADALVAAAAATSGLLLWTTNRKPYPMPDVRFYEA